MSARRPEKERWKRLRRRSEEPAPTRVDVVRATARFLAREGNIRKLPAEEVPERPSAMPSRETMDEDLYLVEQMYGSL